jgi:hypothetical protein
MKATIMRGRIVSPQPEGPRRKKRAPGGWSETKNEG